MTRRHLLAGTAAVPLSFAQPPVRSADLTLTALEIFRVPVNRRGAWLLVRLTAKGGLTGIGDASHGGSDEAKIGLIRRFYEKLRGRTIYDVEFLRREAEPVVLKSGPAAAVSLSGLEQCLWDLQGKAAGVPCYQLFGGLIDNRVRNYANINRSTEERSPEGFAAMAEKAVAAGFTAVKLAPFDDMPGDLSNNAVIEQFTALGIRRAEAVRRAIGPKTDLLIDVHSHLDVRRGIELAKRMEPLNLFWLEEVVPAKPPSGLAEINRAAAMRTAGGEAIYGVRGFLPYLTAGAVDIAMPDVKYCGGMLELKKIAALAEALEIPIAPHGPASPVGNFAAAHVCASVPNSLILEYSFGEVDWREQIIEPAEKLIGGVLTVPPRPGLGITLNDKMTAKHKVAS